MALNRLKLGLVRMDRRFFEGNIQSFHSRYIKYRGKAYLLTGDLFFPPHTSANRRVRFGPAGELLAIGGDLSPERMIHAYKNGISPVYFHDEPILWWTSEIRCVLFTEDLHIPKDVQEIIRKNKFRLTVDQAFPDVVSACAELRQDFTWLIPERIAASCKLHELGIGHSVEVWQDDNLVGGLFGVALGTYFRGESMFSRVKHASKLAFTALCLRLGEMNFSMIDNGLWPTDHLNSLGAVIIPRDEFLERLDQSLQTPDTVANWNNLFENWDLKLAVKNHVSGSITLPR